MNFKEKGSALVVVTVLSGAVSLITGSLLKGTVTEYDMSERNIVRINAQNAAESTVENGVAQLVERWKSAASFASNELEGGNSPLTVPTRLNSFMNNASVRIDAVQLQGQNTGNGQWVYINPDDPKNEFDPQKGKYVYTRKVTLLSKSEAKRDTSKNMDAYAKIVLEVRDAPLFTHAVFYNMDLEYHPGPKMDMHGPVHTNGDLYGSAGNNLYFHSTVTTSKDYLRGFAPGHPQSGQKGQVWFKDNTGTFLSDYKGSGDRSDDSSYYDSTMANWTEFSSNRWNGNLQTQSHGVPVQNPVGFESYVRDNPDTAAIDDQLNYSYALIEPNLNVKNGLNHPDKKGAGEKQKIARKAGMIIRLHEGATSPSSLAHRVGPNYFVTFHKLKRSDSTNPNSSAVTDGSGAVTEIDVEVDSDFVANVFDMEEYSENSSGKPTSGLWDARRGKAVSTLNFDMGEFRKGVDDTDSDFDSGAFVSDYDPEDDYNGVVYFEFPINSGVSGREDKVVLSKDNLGLMVYNAKKLPNPSVMSTDPNRDEGMTIGTNNTMYVKGSFNADGDASTGSSTKADDPSNPEAPASLFADSITVLSDDWDGINSKGSKKYRVASFTEVNAAMVQGILPTGKGGATVQSGGNHNFLRMLEKWSGVKLRYRGSMVSLFESEIGNQPVSTRYYAPPVRDWGYYEQLSRGTFPPGTPVVRSFKKASFDLLNETQYNSAVIPGNFAP